MVGDFTLLDQSSAQGGRGAALYNVATGTNYVSNGSAVVTSVINPGEPVNVTLGAADVGPCANGAGVVATDSIVGIAATNSTNSVWSNGVYVLSNALGGTGTVSVVPLSNQYVYLANPTISTAFIGTGTTIAAQQQSYDTHVGDRVTIALTNGSYTVNATDGSSNGLVIQALNVAQYPGKVAVAFRNGLSNLA